MLLNKFINLFFNKSLARILALYIMGFGLLIAFLSSAAQFYYEYQHEMIEIEKSIEEVHQTIETLLTESLWITNDDLVSTIMQGVLNLPNIESVKVTKENGDILLKGQSKSKEKLIHKHQIYKIYRGEKVLLGIIEITANLDNVFLQVTDHSLMIISSQAIWSIILSIAAMVFFYNLVGQHLYAMSEYSKNISIDTLNEPLIVRQKTNANSEPDEIGRLETAINYMRKRLKSSLDLLKSNEIKLSESNQVMDAVLQNTHIMAALLDANFNFIWVNRAYANAGNHDPLFYQGKNHFELYPHKENQIIFQNVVKNNEPFFATAKPFEHPDQLERGTTYWDWSLIPVKDSAGGISSLVFTLLDVTNQVTANKKLEESEKQFRSLVETTKAVAWELDLGTYRFNYMSPRIFDITGYKVSLWEGFDFWAQTIHYDDRDKAVNFCQTETEKGRDHEFEYRMITAAGKTVWIRDMCTVIKNGVEPLMLRGYFFDITEQKRAAINLQKSEEKFSKAFKNVPLLMTISTIDDGRYLEINEAFIQATGYTRQMTIGKTSAELGFISKEDRRKLIDLLVSDGRVFELELELKRANNSIMVCLYSGEIIEIDGEKRLLSIAMDITDRKKMEIRLQQAQKIESIGTLAGGIAHDFNNILSPIIGMSEMLIEDLPSDSPEQENAGEIFRAGIRGRELVKQILAFSRQSEHKMIPTHVQHILKEVLKLTRSTIPTNIQINQDIQSNCGLVMADPTQIHQIAMNIATNAYHAVSEIEGGVINVQLKEVELTENNPSKIGIETGRYAVLSISDNGYGMSADIIDKIFDPYFTTKEQGRGTGLGLAVVYGIVQEHKGTIKVYSEVGKGATFDIYLPLLDKPVITENPDKNEQNVTGSERILLVDDEAAIAKLEKLILERLGYKVTSRLNSIEALEAFKARKDDFDLVITDMSMPNMTGDQLAKELVSIRADIPVIICTGFSEKLDDEKVKEIGVKGLLMKPVVKVELAKMVRKILDEAKG